MTPDNRTTADCKGGTPPDATGEGPEVPAQQPEAGNAELVMYDQIMQELETLRTSYTECCEQLGQARRERDEALSAHAKTAALHSAAEVQIAELNGLLEAAQQSLAAVTVERDRLFRANEQKAAEIVRLIKEVGWHTDVARKLDKRRNGYRDAARMNANVARVMAVYAFGQENSPNVFGAINSFPSVCKTAGVDLTPDLLFAATKAIIDGTSLATVELAEQADKRYSEGALVNDYVAFKNLATLED